METKNFSKKEAIKFGWDAMKANFWFFVKLLIVVWLIYFIPIYFIPRFIANLIVNNALVISVITVITNLAFLVLSTIVTMGLIKIFLKFSNNEKGELSDIFSSYPLFFKYLFGSILYGLITFGGFILLIVPGIIWAVRFQFFSYLIVDKGLKPIEALKKSSVITDGARWNLFVFGLLLGGINILGALCLGIGLFTTIPTTMIAQAFVYRKLLNLTELNSPTV